MNNNNPVGNIPIETPILRQINVEIYNILHHLTADEKKMLQKEINSVTEENCDYKIYDIAQMLKDYASMPFNGV
ncbi:MAG: hypothetical protein NC548_31310 [Lachnospiraceae bacterium]|nr:hypothetical protein [Bacteroides fragilis]MCM1218993.1 hypothetical protein [Lachnospiraceae bacterium]